jgi:hypothetical protein
MKLFSIKELSNAKKGNKSIHFSPPGSMPSNHGRVLEVGNMRFVSNPSPIEFVEESPISGQRITGKHGFNQ